MEDYCFRGRSYFSSFSRSYNMYAGEGVKLGVHFGVQLCGLCLNAPCQCLSAFYNAFVYLNNSYGRQDAVRKAQEFGRLRVMRRRILF